MIILNGHVCSIDWPKLGHRPCGDIGVWSFNKSCEADKALHSECGILIDHSLHIHSVFLWEVFTVENHCGLVNA